MSRFAERAGVVPHVAGVAFAPARALVALAALATLGFPGCPDGVTEPGAANPRALSMSNCWPNDDGRSWTFAATTRQLDSEPFDFVPPSEPVPEVTLADARRLLSEPVRERGSGTSAYEFRMWFDGEVTTGSGVTTQFLVESFAAPPGGTDRPPASFERRFLARLAEARPDLRPRLDRAAATGGGPRWQWTPYFLHGYAFSKGPRHVGSYGDADTLLAWKFLESGLWPGLGFRHRLVPSLADDVWLHARVEGTRRVELRSGESVPNALEVTYLIDYGVATLTDSWGTVLGRYRIFDYGRVLYAPGIGPVHDVERRLACLGRGVTHGVAELELELLASSPGAPARLAARPPGR